MRAKIAHALAICLLFSSFAAVQAPAGENGWQELKGTHFLIYSEKSVNPEVAQTVLLYAEQSYDRTVRYFGSLPKKNFWLWENRCKIYLYESQKAYSVFSKQPEWSGGFSIPSKRTVVSYQNAPNFLESVLPHEMAHLIFREFVGFQNGEIPRWLDEGFAVWQEQGEKGQYDSVVTHAVSENRTIPLRELNTMKLLSEKKTQDAALFYAQSQSMVRFLLEGRDPSYFINFCRSLRDGEDFEEALRKNYSQDFPTLSDLENRWKESVQPGSFIK